jgi:hypothetical protein
MKPVNHIKRPVLLSLACALTISCSGKTEDVRINLCREMTGRILDSMQPITWHSQETEFRKAGDAAIRLAFSVTRENAEQTRVTSTCFFEHNLPEESALDHVNPLAAYSTVPYTMTIQGKPVPKDVFSQALRDEQLEPFRNFAESVRNEIENLKSR